MYIRWTTQPISASLVKPNAAYPSTLDETLSCRFRQVGCTSQGRVRLNFITYYRTPPCSRAIARSGRMRACLAYAAASLPPIYGVVRLGRSNRTP